jgi:hypothetical protein
MILSQIESLANFVRKSSNQEGTKIIDVYKVADYVYGLKIVPCFATDTDSYDETVNILQILPYPYKEERMKVAYYIFKIFLSGKGFNGWLDAQDALEAWRFVSALLMKKSDFLKVCEEGKSNEELAEEFSVPVSLIYIRKKMFKMEL